MIVMDDNEDGDDEYDIFESSMESLFGHHQTASGKPGQRCRLDLGQGIIVEYIIPLQQEASNTRLFAHYQWDAGLHLALMLQERSTFSSNLPHHTMKGIQLQSKTVLELGAGTGLPSLICALGKAKQVLITDYPDKGLINTIKENINMNKVDGIASVRGLDWSDEKQVSCILQDSPQSKGYNLILCADVLWLSSSHSSLLKTVYSLLERATISRVLVLSGFHTGRRVLLAFFCQAIRLGLCADWEDENGGVSEYNVITQKSRPWSAKTPFPTRKSANNTIENDQDDIDEMDDYTERTKWLLYVSLRWADIEPQ